MNLFDARRILDRHKEGTFYSLPTITKALIICGDIREMDESLFETGERPSVAGTNLVECETVRC